jgi:hypothetical protein
MVRLVRTGDGYRPAEDRLYVGPAEDSTFDAATTDPNERKPSLDAPAAPGGPIDARGVSTTAPIVPPLLGGSSG